MLVEVGGNKDRINGFGIALYLIGQKKLFTFFRETLEKMCLFIFCRVPFPILPLNELVVLLLEGEKWTFLCTAGTPCQLLNMLFNSASHSVRYYYPYFCRWGNWSAELWSNLFKIILLLSGRSGILTWVCWFWSHYVTVSQIVSWSLKKS